MNIRIRILLIVLLNINTIYTSAQKDTRSRTEINISKDFLKYFTAEISSEYRTNNDFENTDKYLVEPSITYTPLKFLELSVNYRREKEQKNKGGYKFNNIYTGSVSLKYKYKNWRFSYKTKYQKRKENGDMHQLIRFRPKIAYKMLKGKITTYVSNEWFYNLTSGEDEEFYKRRTILGIEYKINSINRIQLYYGYQTELNQKRNDSADIIGITYKIKL